MQDFIFKPKNNNWLKNRGYLHVTKKWNVKYKETEIYNKVQSPLFVSKHAFFPLIHAVIKERKYKKHPQSGERAHVHKIEKENRSTTYKPTAKSRPLHYATHIDALIFSFYSTWLIDLYETKLKSVPGLSDSVIAYRKIPQSEKNEKGKSTINFAKEAFKEIEVRSEEDCAVLMFDIESFFSSLDHTKLKLAWAKLLNRPKEDGTVWKTLPADHYNVFKACTQFNYILRDELRLGKKVNGRRQGFDEEKLASIRKEHGIESFFADPRELREAINSKAVKVYGKQFMKKGIQVGIPQGLPISAVLANLYLLEFDQVILSKIVGSGLNGYYRRYSDDILIICKPEQIKEVEKIVLAAIDSCNLTISTQKTETFKFKRGEVLDGKRLTYLGFEYNGKETLVKSANLAKFYRRMIHAVKLKAERAVKISRKIGGKPIIFKSRIVKLYKRADLSSDRELPFKIKKLEKSKDGTYYYKILKVDKNKLKEDKPKKGNYISYMKRASTIINSKAIFGQIRKRKIIFHQAMTHHVKRLMAKGD